MERNNREIPQKTFVSHTMHFMTLCMSYQTFWEIFLYIKCDLNFLKMVAIVQLFLEIQLFTQKGNYKYFAFSKAVLPCHSTMPDLGYIYNINYSSIVLFIL